MLPVGFPPAPVLVRLLVRRQELLLARQRERAPPIGLPLARESLRLAGLLRCPGSPSFRNLPERPEPWH